MGMDGDCLHMVLMASQRMLCAGRCCVTTHAMVVYHEMQLFPTTKVRLHRLTTAPRLPLAS